MQQVKILSDLAMISAGETPMEVDRVSCFLSAVMGFAPLIFDLDRSAGFHDLLDGLKHCTENIIENNLIKKWVSVFLYNDAAIYDLMKLLLFC